MFSAPSAPGQLPPYSKCNDDSPSRSPQRASRASNGNLKALPLVSQSHRPMSQCTSASCNSTSELVEHKQNGPPSFIGRIFSWSRSKEKVNDAEKLGSSLPSQENITVNSSQPHPSRAFHGWKLVLFGSCNSALSSSRIIISDSGLRVERACSASSCIGLWKNKSGPFPKTLITSSTVDFESCNY